MIITQYGSVSIGLPENYNEKTDIFSAEALEDVKWNINIFIEQSDFKDKYNCYDISTNDGRIYVDIALKNNVDVWEDDKGDYSDIIIEGLYTEEKLLEDIKKILATGKIDYDKSEVEVDDLDDKVYLENIYLDTIKEFDYDLDL
jgi:hypothetical protein